MGHPIGRNPDQRHGMEHPLGREGPTVRTSAGSERTSAGSGHPPGRDPDQLTSAGTNRTSARSGLDCKSRPAARSRTSAGSGHPLGRARTTMVCNTLH